MKRVIFKKGQQRAFLDLVKEKLNAPSIRALNQYGLDIPYPTLKNYYSEHMSLPETLFNNLCYLSKLNLQNIECKIVEGNWGQKIGGKKGIKTVFRRYSYKLEEWRKKGQKNSPIFSKKFNLKPISIPILDEKLAEFIGVYLGDGTITKYQLKISGDSRYDLSYFNYLSNLVYELFGIWPSIKKERNRNTLLLVISSKNVSLYFNKELNIQYGHKIRNKTIIPETILNDTKLKIACLRGLIDTDGSISRRGRWGSQFCIQFTSHNNALLNQVYEIGKNLEIFTYKNKSGAGTNKWENIVNYFKTVGSSNLKHVVRFYERFKHRNTIYQKDLPKYYRKSLYNHMNIPFKLGPIV